MPHNFLKVIGHCRVAKSKKTYIWLLEFIAIHINLTLCGILDVASCSTISSALISRQTQATHIDRQTALERSTTIDLYDLSIDHEDNVFRDTTTSPDTSFLPTSVSRNTLPPKNTNRLRDTTQNIRDYFSGDQRWPCGLTNFHFSLCFGMVGFTVFWTGLLLRIYLPHEYFS